ncbi:MAG: MiaB/RimO family radical SAM methylthiotransferase [Elusimicrobiota bacterium]
MKKLYIVTDRCIENRTEASLYTQYLQKNGYKKTDKLEEADLIILFTCGFAEWRENMWMNIIKKIQKNKKKDAELIIGGCLSKINGEKVRQIFSGTMIGPYEIDPLKDMLNLSGDLDSIMPVYFQRKNAGIVPKNLYSAHKYYYNQIFSRACVIKVSSGCTGNCTFCAIKKAKSKLQSTSIERIVESLEYGLEKGYRNIILSADDLGSYGCDIGTDMFELLNKILKISSPQAHKMEIRYLEPKWLIGNTGKFRDLLKDTEKISFICIPIQSGSGKILKLMNRDDRIQECIDCVNQLYEILPSTFIRTHFIAGFPGETDDDFSKTLKLIDEMKFDIAQVYRYSDRQNIRASELDNKVPEQIKKERAKLLETRIKNKTRMRSFIKYHRYRYCKLYR